VRSHQRDQNEISYDGVILAAGRGTRMEPFSEHFPKPILPILNKPLILHQIEFLRSLGVRQVYIVIGHLGHEIALELSRIKDLDVTIHFVEQKDSLGIAHAVMQLERRIHKPFFLLLGDIYFEMDPSFDPVSAVQQDEASAFLAVMNEPSPEAIRRNYAVHMDEDGVVQRVVEKPRFPRSHWKGCGLYWFDVSFFDAVRRTPQTAGRNEYELTDAIQIFIDDGARIIAREGITCDINLTFPYDLILANMRALMRQGQDNVIDKDAVIHGEAKLSHCIVGPGARIDQPVTLRRSILFPNAVLPTDEPVDRAVITQDRLVDCRYWLSEKAFAAVGLQGLDNA
jgi:NDP-sugar pyrophosphorylase family protein